MKKSELIKIIKEEVESVILELGTPPVMALRTGDATRHGAAMKKHKEKIARIKAHNKKFFDKLLSMPKIPTLITIEPGDIIFHDPLNIDPDDGFMSDVKRASAGMSAEDAINGSPRRDMSVWFGKAFDRSRGGTRGLRLYLANRTPKMPLPVYNNSSGELNFASEDYKTTNKFGKFLPQDVVYMLISVLCEDEYLSPIMIPDGLCATNSDGGPVYPSSPGGEEIEQVPGPDSTIGTRGPVEFTPNVNQRKK